MEEILASIRRIISDDEAKPAAAAPPAAANASAKPPSPTAKPAMAGIPPSKIAAAKPAPAIPAATSTAPAPVKNSQDEIDAMMAGFDGGAPPARAAELEPEDEVFELTEQMAMPEMPRSSFQKVEPDDDLEFTDTPATAPASHRLPPLEAPSYDQPSFSAASPPRADMLSTSTVSAVESAFNALATTVLSNNARTLEDLVKEMLRPMLKSWLDDNLPNLVERIVKAEIERVSRGR